MTLLRILTLTTIATATIAIVWLAKAEAHEAPLGWTYGFDCCASFDCKQMPEGEIGETSAGYLVRSTGEVIPYSDKRIRQSKDEFFHRCAKQGDFSSKSSLCLYRPDRGF